MSRSRDLANLANNATGLETLTVSDITDLTATATELNYVDGVSSALQTQIDSKIGDSNPTITLGNNTTFPTGIIESQTVYKYALSSNSSYAHSGSLKIATRTSSSDASVESISVNGGYTYLYSYNGMMRIADGNTHWRAGELALFDDDTDRNQAGTTTGGEKQRITVGRESINNSTASDQSGIYGLF